MSVYKTFKYKVLKNADLKYEYSENKELYILEIIF